MEQRPTIYRKYFDKIKKNTNLGTECKLNLAKIRFLGKFRCKRSKIDIKLFYGTEWGKI